MQIVIVSDFHGTLPGILPKCDLLLIGGDVGHFGSTRSSEGYARQLRWWEQDFVEWLESQPAEVIVGIAGNHDFIAQEDPKFMRRLPWIYLEDETAIVDGLRIHGSPYAKKFGNWAFMEEDDKLKQRWEMIPDDTDILMVHGPAYQVLDRVWDGRNEGSKTLIKRIDELNARLVVTGHIHEAQGVMYAKNRLHVNAALAGGAQPVIVGWGAAGYPILLQHPSRGEQ